MAKESLAREAPHAESREECWEDIQDAFNKEIPNVQEPAVPPVSTATKLLFQHMAAAIARAIQTQQAALRLVETGSLLKEFCRLNPPTFHRETNPLVAKD